jgi:hypothetical protein
MSSPFIDERQRNSQRSKTDHRLLAGIPQTAAVSIRNLARLGICDKPDKPPRFIFELLITAIVPFYTLRLQIVHMVTNPLNR